MVDVLVEFDYTAEQDDELTIKVGEVVKNVVRSEGGWWEGELNGKKGMFPDNFVKVIKDPEKEKEDVKKQEPSKRFQKDGASVRELANKLKDGVGIGTAPQKRKEAKKYAKAEFAYDPENDDELKIEVGDVVEITKQDEEGWWEGNINGRTGVFPSNFVKILDEPEQESESTEDKEKGETTKVKKVIGVGLGNIFENGPIKLRSTGPMGSVKKPAGQTATNLTAKCTVNDNCTSHNIIKKKSTYQPNLTEKTSAACLQPSSHWRQPSLLPNDMYLMDRAVVRYSYVAENEDELSLKEGDIIVVLDKELEDAGWWKGEVHGKIGVFPDNFVEAIEPEEKKEKEKGGTKMPPPKLPDKGPVADSNKHETPAMDHQTDKHVRKKEADKHPPILPSKKPALPPPVGRKPPKIDPARPQSIDKNASASHSTKEESRASTPPQKEEKKGSSESGFDSVETKEKLTHLTTDRPKGPSKRPPSQVMLHNEEVQNGDIKESLKEDAPGHRNLRKEESHHVEKKSHHGLEPVREKPHHHPGPVRPPDPSPAAAGVQSLIEELRREMRELKAHTVSVAAYEELKKENERLKHELESMKNTNSKRFRDIFQELDEEKKIRLGTQVEMERIRKLCLNPTYESKSIGSKRDSQCLEFCQSKVIY
ncbi:hypothetical protein ScPMuIL_013340 [Solemya velum]